MSDVIKGIVCSAIAVVSCSLFILIEYKLTLLFKKRSSKIDSDKARNTDLYNALTRLMDECSMHGQCDSSCPLYDDDWKCIRCMPPAYWKAITPNVFKESRKDLPRDKLMTFSCEGCVDFGHCDNKSALDSVGFRIENVGCTEFRTVNDK